ncbi:urease accessory protein UreD [Occultella kanbiaonis]|uniref:urease accessory protein UreD n=1 Tax=Occultella kanbiaonis TaxID=2675754 RepID=UPI0012B7FDE6|nr:urease accessory protein UreD [Occultella kanbiaonis]
MSTIAVAPAPGRARCRLVAGALSPRILHADDGGARVALVATGALLLGGDEVRIDVEVAPGGWLEVVETAGTVAYDAGGTPSGWHVRAHLGEGARLSWCGLPLVVADGAHVRRSTELTLAAHARALLRETLVLGRAGETGGLLRATTRATLDGTDLLVEDLDLAPAARTAPGVLGELRVLDTTLALGWRPVEVRAGRRYDLDGPGAFVRHLGADTHSGTGPALAATSWRADLDLP